MIDSDSIGYALNTDGEIISTFTISEQSIISAYSQWVLFSNGNLVNGGCDIHKVFIVDTTGNLVCKFGREGNQPGYFSWPTAVGESPTGLIYISDSVNNRIQIFRR